MLNEVFQQMLIPTVVQCYANGIDPVKEGILVKGEHYEDESELEEFKKSAETWAKICKAATKVRAVQKQNAWKALKHAGFCGDDALKIVIHMDTDLSLSFNS